MVCEGMLKGVTCVDAHQIFVQCKGSASTWVQGLAKCELVV